MSVQYDEYLRNHKLNVIKGYRWSMINLPHLFSSSNGYDYEFQITKMHDNSKYNFDEYKAYDDYFYGNENKSQATIDAFNKAWCIHIHQNPHHWQYWVLINDDPDEGVICIEIPYNFIIEMICDWWSFSWSKNNLFEIFKWYDSHKDHIKFHPSTRKIVEDILFQIKDKLENLN